jgi:hypothetical protein
MLRSSCSNLPLGLAHHNLSPRVAGLAAVLAFSAGPAAIADPIPTAAPPNLEPLRQFYLRNIHVLRDYRPGKNSFVEGPDRRLGSYTAPGQRLTLLDVDGPGSLRHLWSTWRKDKGNHRLDFFVDGASQPALSGTLDDLIARAQELESPPVPVPGFVGAINARNYFLPFAFARHLRLEMETVEPTNLIFYQIDYRTGANSADPAPTTNSLRTSPIQASAALPPGGKAVLATATGPGILRRWALQTDVQLIDHPHLNLLVRYDGAPTAAVRSNIADFFGPFRGASVDTDPVSGRRTCYLPMPFAHSVRFELENRTDRPIRVTFDGDLESAPKFDVNWGYFHALAQTTPRTLGYRQHQVLYTRGRGHWLGMALYNTGHDHGGGDFAVLDGETETPAFLHGINGEDYFTFAWFGRGAHHPFAVAGTNEEGRYRHHFENPYPFRQSASLYWGTYHDLSTRSVAYWYQTEPQDTTVPDATHPLNVEWECFGPVPLKRDAQHRPDGDFWAVLPDPAALDAGQQFDCRCVKETFRSGWMKQRSIGPMLDLTYLSRQGTRIKSEIELGGMGHAFLARRQLPAAAARTVTFQLSHDDPIRVLVNGREVYRGGTHHGFATRHFPVALRAGKNEVLVQVSSFFNVNFNWAGFALRVVD